MFDRLEFMLSEAFVGLRRNGLMTFAATTTVAVSLFLIGGLGYVYLRVQDWASTIPSKFEMRVFLKDAVHGEAAVGPVAVKIRAINGVAKVTWIPKDKFWAREQSMHPEYEGIENPYPESFKLELSDLSLSDKVVESLHALPEVEAGEDGVQYMKDEQELVERVLGFIRWLGAVFGGLLFVVGGILIFNAIKMAVLSRRLEVRIMQLVGASNASIRVPFLIEGLVQGAFGGILAALMILATNNLVTGFIRQNAPDSPIPTFPLIGMLALLGGIGAGYGLACSLIAVRTPLRDNRA